MKAIVAIDENYAIGYKSGELIWRCSPDLAHFKRLTSDRTLVVGRKTYQHMPVLKNRRVLVLGRDYYSVDDLLKEDVDWVIGGMQTYKVFAPYCHSLYISHIQHNVLYNIDNAVVYNDIYDDFSHCRIHHTEFKC